MEQSNSGGKNYQITAESVEHIGDVYYQSVPKSGKDLLDKGIQLLNQRDYSRAADVLECAIKSDPLLSDAHYYLAIALLNGKKPKKLDQWTVEEIEKNLSIAVRQDSNLTRGYALWAIVKHGYYTMNGFVEKPPTSTQLFYNVQFLSSQHIQELIYHFEDAENPYWAQLKNNL
jgi:hypothetical protein